MSDYKEACKAMVRGVNRETARIYREALHGGPTRVRLCVGHVTVQTHEGPRRMSVAEYLDRRNAESGDLRVENRQVHE